MKQKKIMLMAVAMSIVLSLSACGTAAQTGSVESTESVVAESTESVENSTEAFVLEEELSIEESTEESVDTTETEKKTTSTDKTESAGYTYTEDSRTMYAKSTVIVRSLPSTSGNKLGSLSKNQEVAVTGQCNETGWYRISFNNSEGFVSNKYLADKPVAAAASTKTAQAQANDVVVGSNPSGKVDPNDPSTWAPPHDNMYYDANLGQWVDWDRPADGYNRAIAEQVWAYVNEERAAAGLNTLAWDENVYNFACTRAQQIITNFSHEGCGDYGENCVIDCVGTAESIHNQWKGSYGHHNNYMNSMYGSGACAIYVYNGVCYGVENFALASSPQTDSADPYASNQTREYNGETLDLSGRQAEAFDNGNFWVASNGIIVYAESGGNLSCNATGDAAMAALNEYDATH